MKEDKEREARIERICDMMDAVYNALKRNDLIGVANVIEAEAIKTQRMQSGEEIETNVIEASNRFRG